MSLSSRFPPRRRFTCVGFFGADFEKVLDGSPHVASHCLFDDGFFVTLRAQRQRVFVSGNDVFRQMGKPSTYVGIFHDRRDRPAVGVSEDDHERRLQMFRPVFNRGDFVVGADIPGNRTTNKSPMPAGKSSIRGLIHCSRPAQI